MAIEGLAVYRKGVFETRIACGSGVFCICRPDRLQLVRGEDALCDQGLRHRGTAPRRCGQRVVADDKGVAARKVLVGSHGADQTDSVCKRVGVIPCKIALCILVAEHAEDQRQKRCIAHVIIGTELRCTDTLRDAVGIRIADVGHRPCGKVGEGMRVGLARGILLRAEEAHDLRDRLRARQAVAKRKIHAAVRVRADALQKTERMQRLCRRGLVDLVCGSRHGQTAHRHRKRQDQSQGKPGRFLHKYPPKRSVFYSISQNGCRGNNHAFNLFTNRSSGAEKYRFRACNILLHARNLWRGATFLHKSFTFFSYLFTSVSCCDTIN